MAGRAPQTGWGSPVAYPRGLIFRNPPIQWGFKALEKEEVEEELSMEESVSVYVRPL